MKANFRTNSTVAIIHNVRSLHNVGSVLRTADGAGIIKVYLTGYTPSPVDELGRTRREILKTALGAEEYVEWSKKTDIGKLIKSLKKDGYKIIAIEKTKTSKPYNKFKSKAKIAFIMGNEVKGLSPSLIKKADDIVEIPMRGKKESLNVSVAFGVIAYYLTGKSKTL
ncbi:MAG: TrmH family RNA methyltransferase [bacterium]|nr:TrmH family RNA methyltransferase [bacterium]